MSSTSRGARAALEVGLAVFALSMAAAARADVVTDWNEFAVPLVGLRTPTASRALAMMHLAMFDAVDSIDRRFEPYLFNALADPGASPEAAAAAAAHAVLVALFPSRQADLDAFFAASLAAISDPDAKAKGVFLGELVAGTILADRSQDGSAVTEAYAVAPGPGIYQPYINSTPTNPNPAPVSAAALFVPWGRVRPFALASGSQFRGEGPLALTSAEYAAEYDEVKHVGAMDSSVRTPDQTEAALFWAENIQIQFNRIARLAALAANRGLLENARLFALLDMAGVDTTIAVFDTKYTYDFWRPREAIRAGDTDGNDATEADPGWAPLLYVGLHPDYVSQHAAWGAAGAKVLASFLGTDDFHFSISTSTAPGGVSRSFESFSQAAVENMSSRVWLGAHFRTGCRHGFNQGAQVAQYVLGHALKPLKQ